MQNARDIAADGLGVFALLALHIVVGVQQLQGGGDIVFRKAAGLGQAFRVCLQPVADSSGGGLHMVQLFAALRILHDPFFLFQHSGKAAGRFQIERCFACFFVFRFRLRRCLGGSGSFLRGAVILRRQIQLFRLFVQPCTQPAPADIFAQSLERTALFFVHSVQRQALFAVKPFGGICQTIQHLAGLQTGGTGSDHPHEHSGNSRKAPAGDAHRAQGKTAHSRSVFCQKAVRHDSLQKRRIGCKQARGTQTGNGHDAKKHRKRDANCQQCTACAVTFFGAAAHFVCRGHLPFAEHLPEPAGHPAGICIHGAFVEGLLCPAAVPDVLLLFVVSLPALADAFHCFVDAKIGSVHGRTAHAVGTVADILPSALKAVGKSVGHGIAKGAQLRFQLLLHLTAIGLFFCIVFTIVHQNFLTLLPVHTG